MKSLIAVAAAISVLLVGGCSAPHFPFNPPDPQRPTTGIAFSIDAHDVTDTTISMPVEMTIKASALNPDLLGAFEEPDTGVTYPFRDPVTRVDLPVTLPKHTPYGAPVYFPAGETINFTLTVQFFGHYGDVVICVFRDLTGNEIPGTKTTYGIYDQLLRTTSTVEAPGEVTCTYSGVAR